MEWKLETTLPNKLMWRKGQESTDLARVDVTPKPLIDFNDDNDLNIKRLFYITH